MALIYMRIALLMFADILLKEGLLSCKHLRIFRKHQNILVRVFRLLETVSPLWIVVEEDFDFIVELQMCLVGLRLDHVKHGMFDVFNLRCCGRLVELWNDWIEYVEPFLFLFWLIKLFFFLGTKLFFFSRHKTIFFSPKKRYFFCKKKIN